MKKFLSAILTLSLVLSISAIVAYGAGAYKVPPNSVVTNLSTNQSYSYSETVVGTYKYFGGINYSDSKHRTTVCSQYYDGSSKKWKDDDKIAVSVDDYFLDKQTTKFDAKVSWRVYLKPYASYSSGCHAQGYMWLNQK